jgi:hypothetical protein
MRSRLASSSLDWARPPLVLPFTSKESCASALKPAPRSADAGVRGGICQRLLAIVSGFDLGVLKPWAGAGFCPGVALYEDRCAPPCRRGAGPKLAERAGAWPMRGISRVQCSAAGWLPMVTCSCAA